MSTNAGDEQVTPGLICQGIAACDQRIAELGTWIRQNRRQVVRVHRLMDRALRRGRLSFAEWLDLLDALTQADVQLIFRTADLLLTRLMIDDTIAQQEGEGRCSPNDKES